MLLSMKIDNITFWGSAQADWVALAIPFQKIIECEKLNENRLCEFYLW